MKHSSKLVGRKLATPKWSAPPQGQLKINTDFIPDTLQGSWGFIIRDHEGEAILAGAGRLIAVSDALTAETAACQSALQVASDHGISRIQLEVDSSVLKHALLSPTMDLASCGMMIMDTRFSLREHFVCSGIFSIPRACNSVSHELAKVAMCWDSGDLHVWANLLPEFVRICKNYCCSRFGRACVFNIKALELTVIY